MFVCPICVDIFDTTLENAVTRCGHVFHHHCLVKWFQNNESCPTCRGHTNGKSAPIYMQFDNDFNEKNKSKQIEELKVQISILETENQRLLKDREISGKQIAKLKKELKIKDKRFFKQKKDFLNKIDILNSQKLLNYQNARVISQMKLLLSEIDQEGTVKPELQTSALKNKNKEVPDRCGNLKRSSESKLDYQNQELSLKLDDLKREIKKVSYDKNKASKGIESLIAMHTDLKTAMRNISEDLKELKENYYDDNEDDYSDDHEDEDDNSDDYEDSYEQDESYDEDDEYEDPYEQGESYDEDDSRYDYDDPQGDYHYNDPQNDYDDSRYDD